MVWGKDIFNRSAFNGLDTIYKIYRGLKHYYTYRNSAKEVVAHYLPGESPGKLYALENIAVVPMHVTPVLSTQTVQFISIQHWQYIWTLALLIFSDLYIAYPSHLNFKKCENCGQKKWYKMFQNRHNKIHAGSM